jgi:hypothetical protein
VQKWEVLGGSGLNNVYICEQMQKRLKKKKAGIFFLLFFLRQGITICPRLILNFQASCFSLLSAGIIDLPHVSGLKLLFFSKHFIILGLVYFG